MAGQGNNGDGGGSKWSSGNGGKCWNCNLKNFMIDRKDFIKHTRIGIYRSLLQLRGSFSLIVLASVREFVLCSYLKQKSSECRSVLLCSSAAFAYEEIKPWLDNATTAMVAAPNGHRTMGASARLGNWTWKIQSLASRSTKQRSLKALQSLPIKHKIQSLPLRDTWASGHNHAEDTWKWRTGRLLRHFDTSHVLVATSAKRKCLLWPCRHFQKSSMIL